MNFVCGAELLLYVIGAGIAAILVLEDRYSRSFIWLLVMIGCVLAMWFRGNACL